MKHFKILPLFLILAWTSPVSAGLKDCVDAARFIFKRPRLTLLKEADFKITHEGNQFFLFYTSGYLPRQGEENFLQWQRETLPTVPPHLLLADQEAKQKIIQDFRYYLDYKGLPFFPDGQLPVAHVNKYKIFYSHHQGRVELPLFIPVGEDAWSVPERLEKIILALGELPTSALQKVDSLSLSPYPHKKKNGVYAEAVFLGATDWRKITINLFPSSLRLKDSDFLDILRHELGHAVEYGLYGRSGLGPRWKKAIRADGNIVSNYGQISLHEDFAETFMLYLDNKTWATPLIRARFFHRFQILDEIFGQLVQTGK